MRWDTNRIRSAGPSLGVSMARHFSSRLHAPWPHHRALAKGTRPRKAALDFLSERDKLSAPYRARMAAEEKTFGEGEARDDCQRISTPGHAPDHPGHRRGELVAFHHRARPRRGSHYHRHRPFPRRRYGLR